MVWKRNAPAAASAAAPSTGAPPPPTAPPAPAAAAPAALPPVATPPPTAPAAAAPPVATAPRRSRRTAEAPAPATPATVTTAGAVAMAAPALPGFLALLAPKNPQAKSSLAILVDGRTAAGEPNIFPTVYMKGGDTGGSFLAHEMNVEGASADLPLGKDPVLCILLGVRFEILLWPKAYERGVKMVPSSKAILSYDEAEAVDAAQQAAQRYQFRNRQTQDQYDMVGHPTLALEMLVYDPQAGIYAIQTPSSYEAVFNTGKELLQAFPEVRPTPVMIQPITYQTKGSKGNAPWAEHYYKVAQASNAAGMEEIKAEFNKFLAQSGSDPELNAAIAAWSKHTLTAEQLAKLKQIATT
jgi:hypothetical protein